MEKRSRKPSKPRQPKRTARRPRQPNSQVLSEIDAISRLHRLGMLCTQKATLHEVVAEILDAALDITGADFGNIQLLDAATGCLKIAVQRGFAQWWVDFWDNVPEGKGACGTALRRRRRIIIEDVERSGIFRGTPGLDVLRRSGVRAVQSTPLASRSGKLLGMFSTHYKEPHRPGPHTLEWLDLLARQAADLIGQRQSQAELAERSRELARLASEVSMAEHRERRRIADHLHDNLQQWLVGARMQAQAASRSTPAKARSILATLDGTLKQAIDATRNLSRELAPPVATKGNLPETLQWLAQEFQRQHLLEATVETHGDFANVPEPQCILAYTAARELLLNTVKHSGSGTARLELTRTAEGLLLKVGDPGRGYDPKSIAAKKAHGLGLFGIRERAASMGGRLSVESTPGRGTTSTLALPLAAASPAAATPHSNCEACNLRTRPARKRPQPLTRRRTRIVFADDHRIVRESLIALIKNEPGIEVVGQCENGSEAVDLAGKLQPDVVIMDGNMPVMDGIEATRSIKSRWPSIRIIGLSMMEESEGGKKMRAAGADEFIPKSGPPEKLLAAIQRTIRPRAGGGRAKKTTQIA